MAIQPIPDNPASPAQAQTQVQAPATITESARQVLQAQQVQAQSQSQSPGQTPAEGQGSEAASASAQADTQAQAEEDAPILADLADPLKEAYRKLPPEIRKVNNKVFTERAQKLAAREKELEGQQIILNALKSDPANTIKFLAQQQGLKIEEPAPAKPVTDQVQQDLVNLFGPEVAQTLLPALEKMVEAKTQPLKAQMVQQTQQAQVREAQSNIEAFKATHPDFPKYEQEMLQVMNRLRPGEDMTHQEFLELAYAYVTRGKSSAQTVKETVEQLTRAATNAQASTASQGVTASRVATGPPAGKLPTFREAAEAAARGEVWQ